MLWTILMFNCISVITTMQRAGGMLDLLVLKYDLCDNFNIIATEIAAGGCSPEREIASYSGCGGLCEWLGGVRGGHDAI